ncbi:MAG: WXG100 family type VII secretion target [Bacillota bacterium]
MAGRILITPEEVREVANQFRGASEASQEMVNRLTGFVQNLDAKWDGASAEKFYGDFTNWSQQMKHFVTLLHEINMQLNTIAERFEAADRPQ